MKIINNLAIFQKNGQITLEDISEDKKIFNLTANEKLDVVFVVFSGNLEIDVHLKEKAADCDLKCVYLAAEDNKADIRLSVTHECAETSSRQTIKGVLADKASVSFNGVIKMNPFAQKCVGYQNHRAVLLSCDAVVQAVPELEIYADDVQCSHGSAIGPLEKEGLFYLMARGIDEKEAEKMLIRAFLYDLIPQEYHFVADEWLSTHV